MPAAVASIDVLQAKLERQHYIADRGLATAIYLALKLQRPLLLEGEAGVGKTEVAQVLAAALDTELIRLQCYEGLDITHAVYEWNYSRQLLEIRLREASGEVDRQAAVRDLFSDDFLIKRPLLRALTSSGATPPVLLIDELDRADDEFEGFLLEMLADYQVTIPELGTIRAVTPPVVVITSNRTRELHDALKRRCLYHWIDYPDYEKELRIVTGKVPDAPARLAAQVTAFVQELRTVELYKSAGVSETLDWIAALVAIDRTELDVGHDRAHAGRAAEEPGRHQQRCAATARPTCSPACRLAAGERPSREPAAFRRGAAGAGIWTCRPRPCSTSPRPCRHVDIGRRADFYFTLRALLVHRQPDLGIFDEAFRMFWRRPPSEWSAHDLRAMGEQRRIGPPEQERVLDGGGRGGTRRRPGGNGGAGRSGRLQPS